LGPFVLSEVLAHLFSISIEKINADFKNHSDIGVVACEYFNKYSEPKNYMQPLEIKDILVVMKQVANAKGKGSQTVRLNLLLDLCKKCRNGQELLYLFRIFKVFFFNLKLIVV